MRVSRVVSRAAAALAIIGCSMAISPMGADAAAATGQVVVVHGLRGVVADVSVDGKVILKAFQPERTTDPLTLPAGSHSVDVRVTGSAPNSKPVLHTVFDLTAGAHLSAVVHLDADGKPALTLFHDDYSALTAGESRLVLRDAAAAPAFDVSLDQVPVARNLTTSEQLAKDVAARKYRIAASAGTQVLVAPREVPLDEGTANFLYLIGSAKDHSLGWVAQRAVGLASAPKAVKTGNSGLLHTRNAFPVAAVSMLAMLALLMAPVLRRTRH